MVDLWQRTMQLSRGLGPLHWVQKLSGLAPFRTSNMPSCWRRPRHYGQCNKIFMQEIENRKAMKAERREGMVFPSYTHYWQIELSCNFHLAFQNWHVNCCKCHVKAIISIKTWCKDDYEELKKACLAILTWGRVKGAFLRIKPCWLLCKKSWLKQAYFWHFHVNLTN